MKKRKILMSKIAMFLVVSNIVSVACCGNAFADPDQTIPPISSSEPSVEASAEPSEEPSVEPSLEASAAPSVEPSVEPTPAPKKDISMLNVRLSGTSFVYTGNEICPSVIITDTDNGTLYQGIDYRVEYSNNKNAGRAGVHVIAMGDKYEGNVYLTFDINKVSIQYYSAYLSGYSFKYNGSSIKPTVYVRNSYGVYLVKDRDYSVKYSNYIVPGTATVTITGIGNYSGTLYSTYKIAINSVTNFRLTGRSETALKISWNYYAGATGYVVQRYNTTKKEYVNIKNITSERTCSYTNSGLASAYDYKYRVRPYVVYNGKYYFGTYSSDIVGTTKPAKTKIALSTGKKYVKIKWNKVSRVSGYEIYMAKSGSKYTKIATVSKNSNTYTKTKLTSKKYYYVVVRSYVVKKGVKIYSSYSTAKYIKVK